MSIKKTPVEYKIEKELHHLLQEPGVFHLTEAPAKITYKDFLENKMLMIQAIRAGIPYSLFNAIQEYTPFSENDWAIFLDISTKSLQRYKTSPDHSFKPSHSEKIIEMAEVTKVGLDVFHDIKKLKLWLYTPCYALRNQKPIDLLADSYGKELVLTELHHINQGIFA